MKNRQGCRATKERKNPKHRDRRESLCGATEIAPTKNTTASRQQVKGEGDLGMDTAPHKGAIVNIQLSITDLCRLPRSPFNMGERRQSIRPFLVTSTCSEAT